MSIQQLATQGRDRLHSGLAAVDTALLSHMRDESLRSCFRRIEQTPHRMQHVACIYRKEYIDDSASRTVNATWYTLQKIQDPVVWIAFGQDINGEGMGRQEDYSPLLPVVLRKVRMIIAVGGDTRMLHQTFRAAAGRPLVPLSECAGVSDLGGRASVYTTCERIVIEIIISGNKS